MSAISSTPLAADTWGLSGPAFLGIYLAAAIVIATLAAVVGRSRRPSGTRVITPEQLTPVQVALLSGGRDLAVTVALAELRRQGLIDAAGRSTTPVDPIGRPLLTKPATLLDPVALAVHNEAGTGRLTRHSPAGLSGRPAVAAALGAEERRLATAGLVTAAPRQGTVVAACALVVALVALGIARVVAGIGNHKPVSLLVLLVVAVAVALPLLLAKRVKTRASLAGRWALRGLRRTNRHLSPRLKPSWATYGGGSVVLATALFGGVVMYSADPAFAEGLGIPYGETERDWHGGSSSSGGAAVAAEAAAAVAVAAGVRRMTGVPGLAGVGIGWRPEIAGFVRNLPGLGFCEVVAESLHVHGGRAEVPDLLAELRERGVAVVPHGIGLSLGGAEPVSAERVAHLAACAEALQAPVVSEHIAFVRAGGIEAGHLLPLPRTWEAVDAIVANVRRTQDSLPVPLALEPIAALFEWPDAELTEAQFVTEILGRTSALLLLDVANVYANARNAGRDPVAELAAFPTERIAYCHVAGGYDDTVAGGLYHDTHTSAVPAEVLELVAKLSAHNGAWLLERDGNYPPAEMLAAELDAIADAACCRRIT